MEGRQGRSADRNRRDLRRSSGNKFSKGRKGRRDWHAANLDSKKQPFLHKMIGNQREKNATAADRTRRIEREAHSALFGTDHRENYVMAEKNNMGSIGDRLRGKRNSFPYQSSPTPGKRLPSMQRERRVFQDGYFPSPKSRKRKGNARKSGKKLDRCNEKVPSVVDLIDDDDDEDDEMDVILNDDLNAVESPVQKSSPQKEKPKRPSLCLESTKKREPRTPSLFKRGNSQEAARKLQETEKKLQESEKKRQEAERKLQEAERKLQSSGKSKERQLVDYSDSESLKEVGGILSGDESDDFVNDLNGNKRIGDRKRGVEIKRDKERAVPGALVKSEFERRMENALSSPMEECAGPSTRSKMKELQGISAFYPQSGVGAVELKATDLERLGPSEFLNDSVIDFFIKYLQVEYISQEVRDRCHFFNSFFFGKLSEENGKQQDAKCPGYNRVKKWTKNVDIFEKDYLFIPVHQFVHWSLVIVCHPKDAFIERTEEESNQKSPCLLHLDSLAASHDSEEVCAKVRKYLECEWENKCKRDCMNPATEPPDKLFNVKRVEVPSQGNSVDCGLFLLEYMRYFTYALPDAVHIDKVDLMRDEHWFKYFFSKRWFSTNDTGRLRHELQQVILRLMIEQNSDTDSVACQAMANMLDAEGSRYAGPEKMAKRNAKLYEDNRRKRKKRESSSPQSQRDLDQLNANGDDLSPPKRQRTSSSPKSPQKYNSQPDHDKNEPGQLHNGDKWKLPTHPDLSLCKSPKRKFPCEFPQESPSPTVRRRERESVRERVRRDFSVRDWSWGGSWKEADSPKCENECEEGGSWKEADSPKCENECEEGGSWKEAGSPKCEKECEMGGRGKEGDAGNSEGVKRSSEVSQKSVMDLVTRDEMEEDDEELVLVGEKTGRPSVIPAKELQRQSVLADFLVLQATASDVRSDGRNNEECVRSNCCTGVNSAANSRASSPFV